MPTKIPLRATYDSSGNVATGLSEYQSNELISTTFGGTGSDTYAQGEILVGNASGSLTKNTIQGTAGQVIITTGDGTITIGLDSSLGLGIATQNNLGTVKVPTSGGLQIDASGNLSIAPVIGASDGTTFTHNNSLFEMVSNIETDASGRLTNIDKRTLKIQDGITLVDNNDGTSTLQSDGLAVAMSIVFGG